MGKKRKKTPQKQSADITKGGSRKILLPLLLLLNTVAVSVIYFVLLRHFRPEGILIFYMTVFALSLVWYICYNRGFYAKNVTADRLPSTMTDEQKSAFIADVKRREKKSKWVMVFGFPFGFALLFDSFSWLLEDLWGLLSSFFG